MGERKMKEMTLLEFIEKFPDLEEEVRLYDNAAGCCLLCTCLFDKLIDIELERQIDLTPLILKTKVR